MTLCTLVRVWRLLMGGAVVLVALGAVVALGDHEIFVPSADGLRYARQFAVAWVPVFLGACLMEPVPELSGTLSRGARVRRWLRFGLLLGSRCCRCCQRGWGAWTRPVRCTTCFSWVCSSQQA